MSKFLVEPEPMSHTRFAAAVNGHDERIDLGLAALLIAEPEHPDLDVDHYLGELDSLADLVRPQVARAADRRAAARILAGCLGGELGFRGNVSRYDDPENSFLHRVIDRRVGIPITLSVLYVEVGRRLGIPLRGVGFPGHFLVKLVEPDLATQELVLDPFNGGRVVDDNGLRKLLREMTGGAMALSRRMLAAASPRQILVRMLRNLKIVYTGADDLLRAIGAIERILILDPAEVGELRDRGLLYDRLDCVRPALADLERYLAHAPDAEDASTVARRVAELGRKVSSVN